MSQPIFLRIFSGEKLVAVKQFDSTQVIFGKEARVDIDLADPDISNIHAMVEERDGDYYICDLGSKSGTKLNDKGILDEKIQSGDVIQLGNFRIEFYIGIPKPKTKPAKTQMPEAPVAPSPEQIQHSEEVTSATEEVHASDLNVANDLPPEEIPEDNIVHEPVEDLAEQPVVKASVSQEKQEPEVPGLPEKNVHFDRQTITNSKSIEPSNPGIPDESPAISMDPAGNVEVGKGKKKRSRLTYAPPSTYSSVEEIIRPGKGMLIDVSVVWGDRVIETHRIRKSGMVSIGTHPKNDIVVPALQGMLQKQPFVQSGQSVSQVFIPQNAKGFLQLGKKQKLSFNEAEAKGRAKLVGAYYVVELQQGEMVKIDYGNRISVFVTHAGDAPPPIMYGITNSEILSIVGAIMLALILFFLSNTLGISSPEEEEAEEKTVKVTKFVFNRKEPIPKKVVKVAEEQKTPRRVQTPSKKVETNRKEKLKGDPGKAGELRPNKNRIRDKMKLAAEKKGTPSKKNTRRVGKRSAKKGSDSKA
ncbi:MAG: FHA domain-containing protein, partial [Bdellovibrionota bacterium]